MLLCQCKPETYANIGIRCWKRQRGIGSIDNLVVENPHLKAVAQLIVGVGFYGKRTLTGS